MKVQLIMTFFAAQPSDKSKVGDVQQVVVFVNTSKSTISITVIYSFTVFMFYLVKIFQFYSFIILWPALILGNNKYCNFKAVREPENIGNPMVGTSREDVESGRVGLSKISRLPKQSGFPKKWRFWKISRSRLPFLELLYNAVYQPTKYANTQFNFFCQ